MIQQQFINYLLDTKDTSLITYNNLNSDFFSDVPEEYEYILNHIKTYGNIPDKETFFNEFIDFPSIKVTESSDYLIDELYKDKNTRDLATVFNEVKDAFNSGNIAKAMDIYMAGSEKMIQAKHITSVDLLKDHSRYDDYIDRANDWNKYFIKTGFPELDKLIGGWDRNEELATIAARSNVGKSWVLLKCACSAAEQGLNVGIYSGEMSARKVGYRLDTLISHISNSALTKGDQSVSAQYKLFLDDLPNKYKGSLKVITPNSIGGPAGVNALQAFIEKDKLDVLFVDQHSLLVDDHRASNPIQAASNISKDLKNLQVRCQIPIISVSQQNRTKIEDGESVGLEHIAQSDRIAQDSTIVIFFERDKTLENVLNLKLVKSRDSANNKVIAYAVDFDKGIFRYLPEGTDVSNSALAQMYGEESVEDDINE